MLNAVVINNQGNDPSRFFPEDTRINYSSQAVTQDFSLELDNVDILIVPNGSDQIAMASVKQQVAEFLDQGGTVFCFDGFYTDWIPGNQWIMDNSKATKDVRYSVGSDSHGLMQGIEIDDFIFQHGISGWWACGYINTAPGADLLLVDTWKRPVMLLDEVSTPGTLFLSASGPVPAMYSGRDKSSGISRLYQAVVNLVVAKAEQREPVNA